MRHQILAATLFLIGSFAIGKPFYKAELVMFDGTTKKGYASVPNISAKTVDFKDREDGTVIQLTSDDLLTMTFILADGSKHSIERAYSKRVMTKKTGELYSKTGKKKIWVFIKRQHDKMNLYMSGQKYKIDKNGDFIVINKASQGGPIPFTYYFRRPDEKEVTFISQSQVGIEIGYNQFFQNVVKSYFRDEPAFVEKIDTEEFKKKDLFTLYEAYTEG